MQKNSTSSGSSPSSPSSKYSLVFAADSAGKQSEGLTLVIRTLAMDCARQKLVPLLDGDPVGGCIPGRRFDG